MPTGDRGNPVSRTGAEDAQKIDSTWRERIEAKLRDYAADPTAYTAVVKRLTGNARLRLRIGDYRVIFTEDGVVMSIHHVGHRSDVYRRLK